MKLKFSSQEGTFSILFKGFKHSLVFIRISFHIIFSFFRFVLFIYLLIDGLLGRDRYSLHRQAGNGCTTQVS